MSADEARPWFKQAESDFRTANALRAVPDPMVLDDVGCHVTAMCAQAIEKSIKGYVIVNGATPSLDHRPDKYLPLLLTRGDPLLQHRDHHSHLSKLFDAATKHGVKALLDLTPGAQGSRADVPNTEYPWQIDGAWIKAPAGSTQFGNGSADDQIKLTKRIVNTLHKLAIAALRGTGL